MSEDRDPLDALLEEFVESHRRGDAVSVEDYAERHPDLAEQIRGLFPAALAMERAKSDRSTSRPAEALVGLAPETELGDFHLLQEIGRGGMGVVYEADQRSLGRRVALKILPRQAMRDERRVERFRREAKTAARLHHTNIVPIFGFGEHDGYHYYVMQFIRGIGLDLVLAELFAGRDERRPPEVPHSDLQPEQAVRGLFSGRLIRSLHAPSSPGATREEASSAASTVTADQPGPAYWRSLACLGHQVADALGYAHAQGTMHRDIKPANLLLDADGVVWITDFGLASAIEEDGMTRTGDVVGTLQFMAPEQLHGRHDARSDIYSLGLTLYELATGRPAFSDRDRSGLVAKIQQGEPTRPRKIRPGIPIDLETIILKAIAAEPGHRYQSAAALGQDLQLFLEDRPIRARRVSQVEHAWRWCRRNRLVSGSAAVAVVAVIATAIVGWTSFVTTDRALQDTRAAREIAQANLELGMQALEDIFERIAGPDLLRPIDIEETADDDVEAAEATEPHTQRVVSEEEAALLERLLVFYDGFAERNADRADLRADTARAYHRVGQAQARLRRLDDAAVAYRKSLERYREVPDPDRYALERARVHNDLGVALFSSPFRPSPRERGRTERRPDPNGTAGRDRRSGRPTSAERQAYAAMIAARTEASRAQHELALALLRDPSTEAQQFELARTHELLGDTFARPRYGSRGRGRLPEPSDQPDPSLERRLEHQLRALELVEALVAERRRHGPYREAAGRIHRHLARSRWISGESDEARRSLDRSTQLLAGLVEEFPDVPQYSYELIQTYSARPRGPEAGEQADLRLARMEKAWRLALELVEQNPQSPEYLRTLEDVLRDLVPIRRRRSRSPEPWDAARAVQFYDETVRRLEALGLYEARQRGSLARMRLTLARGYLETDQADRAREIVERSLGDLERVRSADPTDRWIAFTLDRHHELLARCLDALGDPDGAAAEREKAGAFPRRR